MFIYLFKKLLYIKVCVCEILNLQFVILNKLLRWTHLKYVEWIEVELLI